MGSGKLQSPSRLRSFGNRLIGLLVFALLPLSFCFAQVSPCSETGKPSGNLLPMPVVGYPTPLLKALYRRDLECVKFLLAAGADANEPRDPHDRTAMHRPAFQALHSHRLDLLAAVIEAGADIEATDGAPQATYGATGLTLLCWATYYASQYSTKGDIELVKYLLSRGARIDHGKADGFTPFMFATNGGRMELVELLFNAGADVNAASISGVTPLHAAGNYPEVVEFLLGHGAKMDPKDSFGHSIICDASIRKYPKKVATLIAHGATLEPACGH